MFAARWPSCGKLFIFGNIAFMACHTTHYMNTLACARQVLVQRKKNLRWNHARCGATHAVLSRAEYFCPPAIPYQHCVLLFQCRTAHSKIPCFLGSHRPTYFNAVWKVSDILNKWRCLTKIYVNYQSYSNLAPATKNIINIKQKNMLQKMIEEWTHVKI